MAGRIGVLTSGGDCPGLNAVIRAVVRRAIMRHEFDMVGILRGWRGLMDGLVTSLDLDAVSGILPRGGTILRTSRTNPFIHDRGPERILENAEEFELDAVIAIGGDDTMTVAHKLHSQYGLKVIGVPKTIDNDVWGTDYTFGFDTTVNIAMEAIDRIHTTAESHDRVMVVEVMGRDSGWIALYAGVAGGADIIIIPENPLGVDEICEQIQHRHDRGKDFSIAVVAEGASLVPTRGAEPRQITNGKGKDELGHPHLGGIGKELASEIEALTGYDTRVTVLGHTQRGGSPTGFDRVLGTRYGVLAADLAMAGKFGLMTALCGDKVEPISLEEVAGNVRRVPEEMFDIAATFFG